MKVSRPASSKKKRNNFLELQERKSNATMGKEEEEEKESQKKKLERHESGCSVSSMLMDTAELSLDSKEDLHVCLLPFLMIELADYDQI